MNCKCFLKVIEDTVDRLVVAFETILDTYIELTSLHYRQIMRNKDDKISFNKAVERINKTGKSVEIKLHTGEILTIIGRHENKL